MFGLIQEPPARRSRSITISNDQGRTELPHHRNRYTPQPPTTARGTYPQNFNSPQAPHFSAADGIFRFRGEIYQAAPRGARQYRLSSPNRGNGGTRYFPKARAWSLSPFEFPCVICRGYYGIIWYGAIGELLEESGEVAIVSKLLIARCPSDTSKRFAD